MLIVKYGALRGLYNSWTEKCLHNIVKWKNWTALWHVARSYCKPNFNSRCRIRRRKFSPLLAWPDSFFLFIFSINFGFNRLHFSNCSYINHYSLAIYFPSSCMLTHFSPYPNWYSFMPVFTIRRFVSWPFRLHSTSQSHAYLNIYYFFAVFVVQAFLISNLKVPIAVDVTSTN